MANYCSDDDAAVAAALATVNGQIADAFGLGDVVSDTGGAAVDFTKFDPISGNIFDENGATSDTVTGGNLATKIRLCLHTLRTSSFPGRMKK